MKFLRTLAAVAFAGLLFACTPGTTTSTPTVSSVTSSAVADVNGACATAMPLAEAFPTSPVSSYVVAACGTAQAVEAVAANPGTVAWLQGLQTQLETLAKASQPVVAVPPTTTP